MSKLRGRPAGPSEKKRQELLRVAEALFLAYGFKKASVDEICHTAKISRVTFYKHFADKSAIALAIIQKLHQELRREVIVLIEDTVPFYEKFMRLKSINAEFQNRLGAQFMADVAGLDPEAVLAEGFKQLTIDMKATVEDFFRLGQKEGAIDKDLSIDFLFFMLQTFDHAFFNPQLAQIIPDPKQRADVLTNFLFFGAQSSARARQ